MFVVNDNNRPYFIGRLFSEPGRQHHLTGRQ
jgi:hypothetical protein